MTGSVDVAEHGVLQLARPDGGARALATAASEAARRGRLWVGLTVVAASSPRTRAAGRDGLVAWAAASAVAVSVKHVVRRPRPTVVPRLGSPPRTSSMPSSHAAAAVAYATAATGRAPITGLVVVPLALVVSWSRAATGRHFPTDVTAGAALGLVTGYAVHRALRPRPRCRSRQPSARARSCSFVTARRAGSRARCFQW